MSLLAEIQFGRELCGVLEAAEQREWLVTNGLGGYASGTVAGTATRRYHGLLMAALQPPVARTMLVSALDETVRYLGAGYSLGTNRWTSGLTAPTGYLLLERFHLEGTKPVWTYALADALLEKRVWMQQGENTTFVQYTLTRARGPVDFECKVLVNYRDFHSTTHAGDWKMSIQPVAHGLRVDAFDGATPFYLLSANAPVEPRHEWYRNYFLAEEKARGLDDNEDRLFAALFKTHLLLGQSVTLVFSTNSNASLDAVKARDAQSNYDLKLFEHWQKQFLQTVGTDPEDEPSWLWQLVLAADQFIVKRPLHNQPDGRTIIAGYPWFNDWGRDIVISLPGLTLATGRPAIAKTVLRELAHFVSDGLCPNNFPDKGSTPAFNTVDAALWFFEAVRQCYEAAQDRAFLAELYPVLASIADAHIRGTRYDIKVDPADGLLFAGTSGVQLTWMDAKIGDWAITPRTGKAVEINALWLNALRTLSSFATLLGKPAQNYAQLAEQGTSCFQKFWNANRQCCFDVIDIPSGGNDASLRPNQIFAVSLPFSPLTPPQQQAVVDSVATNLLTSFGLRSLAREDQGYRGEYKGTPRERDSAYHQGTVWAWLLGPFALAHYTIYRDPAAALSFLEPLGESIHTGGLGSLSEVFSGDPPFRPAGCPAQAWSVAETLRVWHLLRAAQQKTRSTF